VDWPEALDVEISRRKDFVGPPPRVANLDHRELFTPPHGIQWDLTASLRAQFQGANATNAVRPAFLTRGTRQYKPG
jgi:hypothetical protein